MNKEVATIIAQLDNFKTTKDGGGKLTIEFGMDSFDEVKKIIDWSNSGNNLMVVITSFKENDLGLKLGLD